MKRRPLAALLLPLALASCHAPARTAAAPGGVPVLNPATIGAIVLLSVELPPAGTIGEQYAGTQFVRPVGLLQMSDGLRERWGRAARDAGDTAFTSEGFDIRPLAAPSSDAEPLVDVHFGLSAEITQMHVKSVGNVEPFQIDATARVSWELVDLNAGAPVFVGTSDGSIRGADSIEAAVRQVFSASIRALCDDPRFRAALAAARPVVAMDLLSGRFGRTMPREGDSILLAADARNLSRETGVLGGIVTLNGLHGFETTAVLLSRDGIAITDASAARQRWLWAQGMEGRWAVRTLRATAELAMVELACLGHCETVAWAADTALRDRAKVLMVAGPSRHDGAIGGVRYGWRRLRVRRDRDGQLTWTLRGTTPAGGEAVAREDGTVVGIATRNRIVPMGELIRDFLIGGGAVTTNPRL